MRLETNHIDDINIGDLCVIVNGVHSVWSWGHCQEKTQKTNTDKKCTLKKGDIFLVLEKRNICNVKNGFSTLTGPSAELKIVAISSETVSTIGYIDIICFSEKNDERWKYSKNSLIEAKIIVKLLDER